MFFQKKKYSNSFYTTVILTIITILKHLGLGRGGFKKILFLILKFNGNKEIYYKYQNVIFILNPLINSTDAKMITGTRLRENIELNLLKNLTKVPDSVFIDIGANVGYYSLLASAYGFKKIYCFEPIIDIVNRLNRNIEINKLEKLIKVIPMAVGEKNETKTFYRDLDNIGNSSFVIKGSNYNKIDIQVCSLLDFINKEKIINIDAIKIDVEGYEDAALIPILEKLDQSLLPKMIIIEHSNSKFWRGELTKMLNVRKYKLLNQTRGNSIYQINND